jgi:hypothetical protein
MIDFSADEMAYLTPFYQAKKLGGESAADFARRALIVAALEYRERESTLTLISDQQAEQQASMLATQEEQLLLVNDKKDVIQELEDAMGI